ncbi:MAG: hypothetical protein O7F71_13460 [Gammaproteobacteria bacterium]|nr:hypothetical protein [Gammaproteobacteria bacterium]
MNNETPQDSNAVFEKRAREVLQAVGNDVPPEVNERLVAMRRAAIQEMESATSGRWQTRWFWAPTAATAVAVLSLGVFLYSGNAPVPMFDDFETAHLEAAQDMELLEDLEFLAWLEEEARNAG